MPSRKSKFRLGDPAPHFVLPYDQHSKFSLRENLGRGPLALAFIRGTWCPFCRRFLRQVLQSIEAIRSMGGDMVVIASQPLAPLIRFSHQEELPFKILSDAGRVVARQYGVFQVVGALGINVARPAVFLLDERGQIVYQYVGTATDRPCTEEVLRQLDRLARNREKAAFTNNVKTSARAAVSS